MRKLFWLSFTTHIPCSYFGLKATVAADFFFFFFFFDMVLKLFPYLVTLGVSGKKTKIVYHCNCKYHDIVHDFLFH